MGALIAKLLRDLSCHVVPPLLVVSVSGSQPVSGKPCSGRLPSRLAWLAPTDDDAKVKEVCSHKSEEMRSSSQFDV
jgi:hypothetical protein